MPEGVSDSQFCMWRTLFAVAHADDVISDQEVRFMVEALDSIPFSPAQQTVLNEDVKTPQDIEAMFAGITDLQDQIQFFRFARDLVHIDGDYAREEQEVMLKLQKLHLAWTNVDDLVGRVSMELEEEDIAPLFSAPAHKKDFRDTLCFYRDSFLQRLFGRPSAH